MIEFFQELAAEEERHPQHGSLSLIQSNYRLISEYKDDSRKASFGISIREINISWSNKRILLISLENLPNQVILGYWPVLLIVIYQRQIDSSDPQRLKDIVIYLNKSKSFETYHCNSRKTDQLTPNQVRSFQAKAFTRSTKTILPILLPQGVIIQLRIIHNSKKSRTLKKSQYSHSCSRIQPQQPPKYGPPLLKKPKIDETLGHNLPSRPKGLKKHIRTGSTLQSSQTRQSYFDLTLRVGELNFFKRFRNNRYLENFSSKKNVYNICEEKSIAKLHEQLANINHEARITHQGKKCDNKC